MSKTRKSTPILFAIAETSRPKAGLVLAAHTAAALNALGMASEDRPAVETGIVTSLIGARAVTYHRNKRNLVDGKEGTIRLSTAGLEKFNARNIAPDLFEAFMELFTHGKADPLTTVAPADVVPVI